MAAEPTTKGTRKRKPKGDGDEAHASAGVAVPVVEIAPESAAVSVGTERVAGAATDGSAPPAKPKRVRKAKGEVTAKAPVVSESVEPAAAVVAESPAPVAEAEAPPAQPKRGRKPKAVPAAAVEPPAEVVAEAVPPKSKGGRKKKSELPAAVEPPAEVAAEAVPPKSKGGRKKKSELPVAVEPPAEVVAEALPRKGKGGQKSQKKKGGRVGQAAEGAEEAVEAPPAPPEEPVFVPEDARWYVVHTYSGYENKVKQNLEHRIESMGMLEQIFHVVVPVEEEVDIKDGQRRIVERKIFPGYVLVHMSLTDESWSVVRNTPGVTGFVGSGTDAADRLRPTPLRQDDVDKILRRMESEEPTIRVSFRPGQNVRIVDGPFTDFHGVVDAIDMERGKVRLMVNFFGRETPVELDFLQVEKV